MVYAVRAAIRPPENGICLLDGRCRIVDPYQAYRHVVRMPDGSLLNRYWTIATRRVMNPGLRTLKPRNIWSPAQRGVPRFTRWSGLRLDYSSRWLRDTGRLASIRTTQSSPSI